MRRLFSITLCLAALSVAVFCSASPVGAQPATLPKPPPRDYAAEIARLRPSAESGNPAAQYQLAIFYCRGLGVPRDLDECHRLMRLSADHGNADAQFSVGMQYMTGSGVPRDTAQANRWFRQAATGGNGMAAYMLGVNYSTGTGVPRDDAEAVRLLRQAAAPQDNLMAITMLADMIEHGRGGPTDPVEAGRLWRLAASKGFAPASEHLARIADADAVKAMPKVAGTYNIPLVRQGDRWMVTGSIDEVMNVNFILDSGASTTVFPEVVAKLFGLASLPEARSAVVTTGVLANGGRVTGKTFAVRSLRLGDKTISNVKISIIPGNGTPLLGQSFLQMFRSWSIDNSRRLLVLAD